MQNKNYTFSSFEKKMQEAQFSTLCFFFFITLRVNFLLRELYSDISFDVIMNYASFYMLVILGFLIGWHQQYYREKNTDYAIMRW